tara:strand:- start:26 stop:274 length:249 start_codon:yes stop_codon:yes gene_type:complete
MPHNYNVDNKLIGDKMKKSQKNIVEKVLEARHHKTVEFDSDDLVSRLETTIENIEFQKGKVFWDDLQRLYLILDVLKKCKIN